MRLYIYIERETGAIDFEREHQAVLLQPKWLIKGLAYIYICKVVVWRHVSFFFSYYTKDGGIGRTGYIGTRHANVAGEIKFKKTGETTLDDPASGCSITLHAHSDSGISNK